LCKRTGMGNSGSSMPQLQVHTQLCRSTCKCASVEVEMQITQGSFGCMILTFRIRCR